MNKQTCVFWMFTLMICLVHATSTYCQTKDEPVPEFIVIPIYHVDASEVQQVVRNVFAGEPMTVEIDSRQNLLILQGRPNTVAKGKDLVAKLDVENRVTNNKTHVRVFSLNKSRSSDIVKVLGKLISNDENSSLRIADDAVNNNIIVSGKLDDLDVLEELISRLDESNSAEASINLQPENIVVRVTWLVDSNELDETNDRSALRIPSTTLAELVDGLSKTGSIAKAKTLTELETSVQVDPSSRGANRFNNTSMRKIGGITHGMEATGEVVQTTDGKYQLDISLVMSKEEINMTVGSTITLPKNHPVAFSISDVGDFKSAAVVEILDSK